MFTSILADTAAGLSIQNGLLCSAVSLIAGLMIAFVYRRLKGGSSSFTLTLLILPVLVQCVIMMVNGNLGAGVAVMGAFSLVRFRSLPGTSKEILFIFFAMAAGLATGMGQIVFALGMCVLISAALLVFGNIRLFENDRRMKELKILIPENLDYTSVFDEIFQEYTSNAELIRVRTVQLGTMIELLYEIELKQISKEKEMIDAIRVRNSNLTISCARRQVQGYEL